MLTNKKTIIQEALLDINKIQAALNANTKEILRSVAREEIDSVVKESLMEIGDDFEEEDVPMDVDATSNLDMGDEMGGDEFGGEPSDNASLAGDMNMDTEVEPEMGQELGMGADDALDSVNIDMTASSNDDVIAIYKKLSGDDEIEIVNGDIHLNVSEPGEYVIKNNDAAAAGIPTDGMATDGMATDGIGADSELEEVPTGGEDMTSDLEEVPTGDNEGDDVEYEIEMGDDDEDNEEGEEIEEQISVNRVAQNRAGGNLTAIKGLGAQQGAKMNESINRTSKLLTEAEAKYKTLLTETYALKKENTEFKNALKTFKTQLLETVVGNSNLAYFVRLVTEHSTTKAEKEGIMRRFDSVTDTKQSKGLYKTIKSELMARQPINEMVGNKIIKEVATGTSKVLNETTAYVDPSTQRIKDLINRVENR